MENKDETIYIGCQCHSPYHIMQVSLWEWKDQPPELLFVLQADRHRGLWERITEAFRYVCGGENLGWHDVMPNHDDVLNLRRVIDEYNEAYTMYKDKTKEKEVNQHG